MKVEVLIVEDYRPKADLIASIIKSRHDANFQFVSTISAAYGALEREKLHLVILDMTFQISPGLGQAVRKEALAGVELLQFMMGKGIIAPVIVATQHSNFSHGGWINVSSVEELDALLSETFPKIYRGIVKVDLSTTDWHGELLRKVWGALDVDAAKDSGS